jgi:hypothetical protein
MRFGPAVSLIDGKDGKKKTIGPRRSRPGTPHLFGAGLIALTAIWLMRRFLFTSAFPAGTDMLGFIARAKENASWSEIFSVWSPSSFGAPRQFTLENLTGLLTLLTGSPVVTVKLLAFATLIGSGASAYLLAWRWYRSTRVAAIAALLYMTSEASISRWASGQLNVEIAMAAAPLLIYLWAECIERYAIRRALTFSLAASALMLVRLDMLLYLLPFFALFVVVRAIATPSPDDTGPNLVSTLRVAVPAMIALNLYQIVPALGSVRASWLSSGRLFDVNELVDRSLGAYPSVLGFGREIGYLGFTGQQTWFSHPWVSFWICMAAASITVGLAYSSVWRHRDPRTLFLIASALLATFLAKGVRAPMGDIYLWGFDHVPFFGNLRGPNRWLILQALAYAPLAALSIDYVLQRLGGARIRTRQSQRLLVALGSTALIAALLLPVAPTLLSGFKTWRPDEQQVALMKQVSHDKDSYRVASVPYDQTARFLDQGKYHGFEHDLGAESSLWTGHPSIGDGGWNQHASDFVAFSASLLRARDPAYEKLLGTLGAKYLVKFNYPPTAPHLVNPSNPFYQQHAVAKMPGFERVTQTSRGDVYALASHSPTVTFRPNLALILGGSSGLAALADYPGLNIKNWAAVTADDAIGRGGLGSLLKLASEANLILVANEQVEDLAVLAAGSVARLPAISSSRELDRKTELLPSDGSSRRGSLANRSMAPPNPTSSASSAAVTIRGVQQQLELWTRVRTGPTSGRLLFTVDGKRAREVVPLAVEPGGFRWMNVATLTLAPGKHRIAVQGLRSTFGDSYEVDETKLIKPVDRETALAQLERALTSSQGKVAYALDLDDAQKWSPSGSYFKPAETLTSKPAAFWRVAEPDHVRPSADAGKLSISLNKKRELYTFLDHTFPDPQDWRSRPYLSLRYRGTGSGKPYVFIVDFDSARRTSAVYSFDDSSGSWQTRAFSLPTPVRTTGAPDWSHVTSVRIASGSKAGNGDLLELDAMRLSHTLTTLPLNYPVIPSSRERSAFLISSGGHVGKTPLARVPADSPAMNAALPLPLLGSGNRLILSTAATIRENPAPPVRFRRTSPTNYDFSFSSRYSGMIVLNQGFHPRWNLTSAGSRQRPVPAFSVSNGFMLGPGSHSGSIGFTGQRFAWWGVTLSALFLIVILALMVLRKSDATAAMESDFMLRPVSTNGHRRLDVQPRRLLIAAVASGILLTISPLLAVLFVIACTVVLRASWWMPWIWGLGLLAVTPVLVAVGLDAPVNDVAFLFVVFMSVGLILLFGELRRSSLARPRRRCRGTTRSGERCRRAPIRGSEYCSTHSPHPPIRPAELVSASSQT